MDKEDFTIEAQTTHYFGCEVTAYRTDNTEEYTPAYPWRFTVKHNGKRHFFYGLPNKCHSKASALKRGWFRAKWFTDGSYNKRYSPIRGLT